MMVRSDVLVKRDFQAALDATNVAYRGNLKWNREPERMSRVSFRMTLRTRDSRAGGSRFSWSGRHLPCASWHAHRDFMREVLARDPDAVIRTGMAVYRGREDFEASHMRTYYRNVGSVMNPAYLGGLSIEPEPRKPEGTVIFGGTGPEGGVTGTLRMSQIRACPNNILVLQHYHGDTCDCYDAGAVGMRQWGYVWDAKNARWAGEDE